MADSQRKMRFSGHGALVQIGLADGGVSGF
jgi:hypothetical protein